MRLADPDATHAIGEALGRVAVPGLVIALSGDLGAGKSVLARGIARGLGITGRVPSPTFVIVEHYDTGRLPFDHVDLYRIDDPDELEQLGLEHLGVDGVAAVEWAERFPELLPPDHLALLLRDHDGGRELIATPHGALARTVWAQVR